jgi:hypothetical protein
MVFGNHVSMKGGNPSQMRCDEGLSRPSSTYGEGRNLRKLSLDSREGGEAAVNRNNGSIDEA